MVDLVIKLELSDQNYQTNGNVIDKSYMSGYLFPMKEFFNLVQIASQCILCQPDS